MRARVSLFRHLQIFFETHLRGVYRFDQFVPYPAHDATPMETGKRRWEFGKTKEIVEGRIGDFEVLLASPLEVPPLGRVALRKINGQTMVTGPLDPATFERMGEALKLHRKEMIGCP